MALKFRQMPDSTAQHGPWFRRNTGVHEEAVIKNARSSGQEPPDSAHPQRHWGDPPPKKTRRPHRIREPRSPEQYMGSLLWKLLAAMMLLVSGAVVVRMAQRLTWFTTGLTPPSAALENGAIKRMLSGLDQALANLTEALRPFLLGYEGVMLISTLLTLLTAAAVFLFVVRRRPGRWRWLRRMLILRRIMCHAAAWLCLLGSAVLAYVAIYYRASVTILGILGAIGFGGFVLFLFKARLFRSYGRLLQALRHAVGQGSFSEYPIRVWLRTQALVTAAFLLVPVALALLEGLMVNAIVDTLVQAAVNVQAEVQRTLAQNPLTAALITMSQDPALDAETLRAALMGSGFTGAREMYAVDSLCSILQAMAVLLTIPLHMMYRHSCRQEKRAARIGGRGK